MNTLKQALSNAQNTADDKGVQYGVWCVCRNIHDANTAYYAMAPLDPWPTKKDFYIGCMGAITFVDTLYPSTYKA